MAIARLFSAAPSGALSKIQYCIEGMHVTELKGASGFGMTVVSCDKSCQNLPILHEQEFSEEKVKDLKGQLLK